MKSKLTAHMIVKNEEQWVWYAIMSALHIVDRILIYDTGSLDKTVSIIRTVKSKKILFMEKGEVTSEELVKLRNEQIRETQTDWFMLLDGDEVWPQAAITELNNTIASASPALWALVVSAHVPVGDLLHFLPESAGKYEILGKRGHYNIRAYRKMAGFSWRGKYPMEAYTGPDGTKIQEYSRNLKLLKNPYWHMTHMPRSSVDDHKKRKYEIGRRYMGTLPEVFEKDRPRFVPAPHISFTFVEKLRAIITTTIKKIKLILNLKL